MSIASAPRNSTVIAAVRLHDRTVVAFHGTRKRTAEKLVAGTPFGKSENDDDWLGHGIYFWEYAPQQAWGWADRRYGASHATSKSRAPELCSFPLRRARACPGCGIEAVCFEAHTSSFLFEHRATSWPCGQ